MVIDSSALIAILFGEPEAAHFSHLIAADGVRLVSAVNHFEAAIVADAATGKRVVRSIDDLFDMLALEVVPVARADSQLARAAYRQFGKGNHPARLNMGDCFAYGLAMSRGQPLLFKGGDFPLTDVKPVV